MTRDASTRAARMMGGVSQATARFMPAVRRSPSISAMIDTRFLPMFRSDDYFCAAILRAAHARDGAADADSMLSPTLKAIKPTTSP